MVEWRKALSRARAGRNLCGGPFGPPNPLSGDDATEIPAPGPGISPRRVRLYTPARTREPDAASAWSVVREIVHDFSDRSERGDPKALFAKYGGALMPMAMSIPFTAAGVAMLVFLPRQAPHRMLPWVFGAIFTLAGLLLFSLGLSGLRTAAAPAESHRDREPWRWDNRWDPHGARPDAPGRSFAGFLGGILFFLLIGVFNVMWTVRKDFSGWLVVTIILVVFDTLGVLMIASILVAIVQRIRAGSPRLSWTRFPFFAGERFEAVFTSGRRLHVTGPVRAILRCVEQVVEDGPNKQREAHPYAVYAHSQNFEPPDGHLLTFDVSFAVPSDVPGTRLSGARPVYWLLEIRAPLAGPDSSTQFLIPIYDSPRPPSTSA